MSGETQGLSTTTKEWMDQGRRELPIIEVGTRANGAGAPITHEATRLSHMYQKQVDDVQAVVMLEQTKPVTHSMPDSTVLASIPSASSASSRLPLLEEQRSPAQTSVASLLRDTRQTDDSHMATSSWDPDFSQSGEDSLKRKGKRRSLFRCPKKPQPSVSSSLIGQSRTHTLDCDPDLRNRNWSSTRQGEHCESNIFVPPLPVGIVVAPYRRSSISAQDSVQLAPRRKTLPPSQAATGSSPDLLTIKGFTEDAGESERAERETSELFQEEAVQIWEGKGRCLLGSCLSPS
jgi:hypothetical protein